MSLGYGIVKDDGEVGPGFLPLVTGLLLAALAAGSLVRTVRHIPSEPAAPRPDEADADDQGRTEAQRVKILRIVFVMVLGAILLVPITGFLVAFGLLVFAISALVEGRRPLPAVAVSVATVAVIYAIFVLFLHVPLPGGLLGIGGDG
jgi:hypothetical protein